MLSKQTHCKAQTGLKTKPRSKHSPKMLQEKHETSSEHFGERVIPLQGKAVQGFLSGYIHSWMLSDSLQ